jgi:hypothetical protein
MTLRCTALLADGILARRRRVYVPGWVRWVFALRAALHTRPLERDLLAVAPHLEPLFLEDLRLERIPQVPARSVPPVGAAQTTRT